MFPYMCPTFAEICSQLPKCLIVFGVVKIHQRPDQSRLAADPTKEAPAPGSAPKKWGELAPVADQLPSLILQVVFFSMFQGKSPYVLRVVNWWCSVVTLQTLLVILNSGWATYRMFLSRKKFSPWPFFAKMKKEGDQFLHESQTESPSTFQISRNSVQRWKRSISQMQSLRKKNHLDFAVPRLKAPRLRHLRFRMALPEVSSWLCWFYDEKLRLSENWWKNGWF